jgi:hypothetical protein
MSDYLAVVEGSVLAIYAMEGGEARQIAALNLTDTSIGTVATIVANLKPYMANGVVKAAIGQREAIGENGTAAFVTAVSPPRSFPERQQRSTKGYKAVLRWVSRLNGEPFTARQMSDALHFTGRDASNRISYLIGKGLVEKVPGSRPGQAARYREVR